MAPMLFRKKPVTIEAWQLTADNACAVAEWCDGEPSLDITDGAWSPGVLIETLEGDMRADVGDWIIRGVAGEFYPVKPQIFAATYEPVLPGTPFVGEAAHLVDEPLPFGDV